MKSISTRQFAPPHIKTQWILFGVLLGAFMALLVRPDTRWRIGQQVSFSFKPELLSNELGSDLTSLPVSKRFMVKGVRDYLKAHPDDIEANFAAIYLRMYQTDVEHQAQQTDFLRHLFEQVQLNRSASTNTKRMWLAYLLRHTNQLTGGGMGPSNLVDDPSHPNKVVSNLEVLPHDRFRSEIAESAVQSEPENAYFVLYHKMINKRATAIDVFKEFATMPSHSVAHCYHKEEAETVLAGMRKACGEVSGYWAEEVYREAALYDVGADSTVTPALRYLNDRLYYDGKYYSDNTNALIRQGLVRYQLLQLQEGVRNGEDIQNTRNLLLGAMATVPIGGNPNRFLQSFQEYMDYMEKKGFYGEVRWAKQALPAVVKDYKSTTTHLYPSGMSVLYWMVTQWLGIEVVLLLLLGGVATWMAYRQRFQVGGSERVSNSTGGASTGILLALVPLILCLSQWSETGDMPTFFAPIGYALLISLWLVGVAWLVRKRFNLTPLLKAFGVAVSGVVLSMVFAKGLLQSYCFWISLQGVNPTLYDSFFNLYCKCLLAVVAPALVVGLIALGVKWVQRAEGGRVGRVYANTLFPTAMIFLTLFMLYTVKAERLDTWQSYGVSSVYNSGSDSNASLVIEAEPLWLLPF